MITIQYDPKDQKDTERARAAFTRLKKSGYTFFSPKGDKLQEFKPDYYSPKIYACASEEPNDD